MTLKSSSTLIENNPFPGLRPFKIEESHLFFGREGQSDEVLLKLSKSRFVGVIGPSGSGKSSFIYCGVMPILYGGFLTDTSPNWQVIVTRPSGGPIDNLSEALLASSDEYKESDIEDKKIKRTIVSTLLRSSSLGLVEAIDQSRRSADVNYLILVDQFEELFRFKQSSDNSMDETLAFVNLLMEAVNYPDSPIYVAITMRSDFIGDCAQFPELTRKINDSHYLIPQMTREQKRRAIEGPIAVGGATVSQRLVQQLLNDLDDNPDQLPILQHSLMRTWGYWLRYKDSEAGPLDLKHYEAIGTMSEALSMHANEAYDELDEHQKNICEIIFKAITEKRGENFGIRRPTRLTEIGSIAEVSEEEVIAVVDKFREPGRSLLTPSYSVALTGKSMIDISHESLMRIWTRLKNWVDDEAEAVQMYQRLAEAASQFQVGKAGLWRPPDLQLALNWQIKHKPTLVWGQRYHPAFERTLIFLEYSKKEFETEQRIKELEQKRKLQRARTFALVVSIVMVLALVALVFAIYQTTEAKKQETRAIAAGELARENEKIAKKEKVEADIARKEAVKDRIKAQTAEADAKKAQKKAEYERLKAVAAEKDANEQRGIAIVKAEEARVNAIKAQEQADIAKRESAKAKRQQYLSTARAIALKSKELRESDPEQQALLAQQGYLFNKEYQGIVNDNDIYNGLYQALKTQGDPLTYNLEGHEKGAARAMVTNIKTNHIYSGGSDGRIIRWTDNTNNKWTSEELVPFRTDYQIYSMGISPDGNLLAVGGAATGDATKNYVELYDLTNMNTPPKKLFGFIENIEHIEFTNDSKGFFARDNAGRSIKYNDFSATKEVVSSRIKINAISLSPDGNKLAGAGDDGILYLWDIKNGYSVVEYFKNPIGKKKEVISFTAVSFAPLPDKRIITGDKNGQVRVITSETMSKLLSGHTAHIEQIKFNNSGKSVVTISRDKSARLWDWVDTNIPAIVMNDHDDWAWCAAFSPDDQQIVVGVHSNREKAKETIHAYPTKIETMAGLLCGYVTRNLTQEEWETKMQDLPYEKTCDNYPANNK
jgi:WD40 repeat protein/energy-coupling factor transporter ATP-binding protein EcfA2